MDDNSEINIYNPNNKDDFYPFGIVLANAIKKVNDSCITGDNYHRSVEALELLMGGREDEIYEDEIYMLNSKHNILESNNKISIKDWTYEWIYTHKKMLKTLTEKVKQREELNKDIKHLQSQIKEAQTELLNTDLNQ